MARKFILALLILALNTVSFAQTRHLKIGLLMADATTHERWQTDIDQFTKRAKELGANVLMRDAHGKQDTQEDQARELLHENVGVLVLNPQDAIMSATIVDMAHKHHVPVLCYSRLVMDAKPDFYISEDSTKVGELQAAYLLRLAPVGNYVLIGGAPTDNNSYLIHDGQMKVLQPLIAQGRIHIVSDTSANNWSRSAAYSNTMDALAKTNDIVGVLAANDEMATGAIQAFADAKVRHRPIVSGQDADLDAVLRIIRGTQAMTVYGPVAPQARMAAEAAVALARGETPKATTLVKDGDAQIPSILLEPVAVDKHNLMDTVFADKYQDPAVVRHELTEAEWVSVAGTANGK